MSHLGLDSDTEVVGFVIDCLIHGSATRLRAFYPFRRRVDILCDSMGINRGPHKRSNLSDVVIMLDQGFTWRKKKVTRAKIEEWGYFHTIDIVDSDESEDMDIMDEL